VTGSGFDRDDLEAAGVRSADALAAVTSGDNTNILSARIAREVFGVANVVARIYDPRRAVIYERLGIPTVATVTWTTEQVARRIDPCATPTEWTDSTGEVSTIERALPDHWAGRLLDELNDPGRFALTAVRRGSRTMLATSGMVGQPGDLLYVTTTTADLDDVDKLLRTEPPRGGHH
jgi:trk system potassium uptake protein TrkA